jgi:hypothetical protein
LQHHGNADRIVAPVTARFQARVVEIEFDVVVEMRGSNVQFAIFARGYCGVGRDVDGRGHDETRVVVGVLADEIDAPWCSKRKTQKFLFAALPQAGISFKTRIKARMR